jgi:hypothetical protein
MQRYDIFIFHTNVYLLTVIQLLPDVAAVIFVFKSLKMNIPLVLLIFLRLCVTNSLASVYQNVQQLPTTTYDFIIIGGLAYRHLAVYSFSQLITYIPGGTGGAVVANRLSENLEFEVLLIEAGPTYVDNSSCL